MAKLGNEAKLMLKLAEARSMSEPGLADKLAAHSSQSADEQTGFKRGFGAGMKHYQDLLNESVRELEEGR